MTWVRVGNVGVVKAVVLNQLDWTSSVWAEPAVLDEVSGDHVLAHGCPIPPLTFLSSVIKSRP